SGEFDHRIDVVTCRTGRIAGPQTIAVLSAHKPWSNCVIPDNRDIRITAHQLLTPNAILLAENSVNLIGMLALQTAEYVRSRRRHIASHPIKLWICDPMSIASIAINAKNPMTGMADDIFHDLTVYDLLEQVMFQP